MSRVLVRRPFEIASGDLTLYVDHVTRRRFELTILPDFEAEPVRVEFSLDTACELRDVLDALIHEARNNAVAHAPLYTAGA